jgi:hypothetical protein
MKICEKNKGKTKTKNENLNRSLGRSNPSARPNTRGPLQLPPVHATTDRWASPVRERGQGIERRRAPASSNSSAASSPGNLSLPSCSPSSFALVQVGETTKVVAEKACHRPWRTAVRARRYAGPSRLGLSTVMAPIAPVRCGESFRAS